MIASLLAATALIVTPAFQQVGTALDCSQGYDGLLRRLAQTPGAKPLAVPANQRLGAYEVRSEHAVYNFTIEGQPAHPTVIKRQLSAETGPLILTLSACGYGDAAAFRDLMSEMEGLSQKVKDYVKERRGAPRP